MLRPALKFVTILCLLTPIAAPAQLIRLTPPKRSSADVGINTLQAPVPTPLLNSRKAFISYELGDITAFPEAYSGGPERAYSEFYTAMKPGIATTSSRIPPRPTSSSPSAFLIRQAQCPRSA